MHHRTRVNRVAHGEYCDLFILSTRLLKQERTLAAVSQRPGCPLAIFYCFVRSCSSCDRALALVSLPQLSLCGSSDSLRFSSAWIQKYFPLLSGGFFCLCYLLQRASLMSDFVAVWYFHTCARWRVAFLHPPLPRQFLQCVLLHACGLFLIAVLCVL